MGYRHKLFMSKIQLVTYYTVMSHGISTLAEGQDFNLNYEVLVC